METLLASWDWGALRTIQRVNLILSGDNAVLIALAAAGLPAWRQRLKAIMFGMVLAVVLRIVLSIFAVYLLAIPGLLLVGGLLLLWIAYSFYKELRKGHKAEEEGGHVGDVEPKTMKTALRQIVIADVSMSLDNVLAVAGAARDNMPMLIIGLAISIPMVGVAATLISWLLKRFPVIAYIVVALVVWIGLEMVWEDGHHLYKRFVVGEHAGTPPTDLGAQIAVCGCGRCLSKELSGAGSGRVSDFTVVRVALGVEADVADGRPVADLA